jgi:hypothetical protein
LKIYNIRPKPKLLFDYLTPSWLFNVEQSLIDLVPLDKKESAGVEQIRLRKINRCFGRSGEGAAGTD